MTGALRQTTRGLAPDGIRAIQARSWLGKVRELESRIKGAHHCEPEELCIGRSACIIGTKLYFAYFMSNFSIPPVAADRLERLGDRLRTARLRRAWSIAALASKAGINRNTLTALEHGKPGTSVVALVSVLWALGLDGALESVADPDQDSHGKALEAARRPKRARSRATDKGYDF